jgi:vacuolar iron transporter family protein
MTFVSRLRRLRRSLAESAGTIVFGMEDGTVSIFGLIFGVAATTNNAATVLIAGASGAVAAAVSMMAGVFLDVETTRDEMKGKRTALQASLSANAASICAELPGQLAAAGLTQQQSTALTGAVVNDRDALNGLLLALHGSPEAPPNPWVQALWMLIADFAAAAVPIVPFVFLRVPQARIVSAVVTIALLIGLGVGRGRIAGHNIVRTMLETVAIGIAAALAGVGIGVLIERTFTG